MTFNVPNKLLKCFQSIAANFYIGENNCFHFCKSL